MHKQHFLLSPELLSLSLMEVAKLSDEEAMLLLAKWRWGSEDEQVCPSCGAVNQHYRIRTRKQYRCKDCCSTFSVTTGTPFVDHKIGYTKLLTAIVAFAYRPKGLAALDLRVLIKVHYRTAFTLLHKIREALVNTMDPTKLSGFVQIDGAHLSGKLRKGRKKKKPTKEGKKDVPNKYAKKEHRAKTGHGDNPSHPNRRIIIVLREVSETKGVGALRTVTAVCNSENIRDINALVQKHVKPGTKIYTDELSAYNDLKLLGYFHDTVNHSKEFSTDEGVNQNQAESYFSRMRRSVIGIYHRITPRYMLDYTTEIAWRDDVRKKSVYERSEELFGRICNSGISKDWVNYCRGNKRPVELIFQA